MGVDGMHCDFRPFKAAGGGGICAFCIGKLVSSSLSLPSQRNSLSPPPSPSFRSDDVVPSTLSSTSSSCPTKPTVPHQAKHSKVASFLAKKKKKATVVEQDAPSMVFQRSRSIAFSAATPQSCHLYELVGMFIAPERGVGSGLSSLLSSSSSMPHNARDRDSGHSLSMNNAAISPFNSLSQISSLP